MSKIVKFLSLVILGMVLSFLIDSNLNYFLKLILIGVMFLPVNIMQMGHTQHNTDIEP